MGFDTKIASPPNHMLKSSFARTETATMKILRLGVRVTTLLLVGLLLASRSWALSIDLPPELESWKAWVLYPHDERPCHILADPTTEPTRRCAWPGQLHIETDPQRARFSQTWQLYADSWVPLPGNTEFWPTWVTVDGTEAPVVEHEGLPHLRLSPGEYQLAGEIPWTSQPATLAIPPSTGLVALTIGGNIVTHPQRAGDYELVLASEQQAQDPNLAKHLNVNVFRRLRDGIPFTLTTRLVVDIAGPSRDELIGNPIPEGQQLLALSSALPAHIDGKGQLIIQARPGQWNIDIETRALTNLATLQMAAQPSPWPQEELWSFAADTQYRVVDLEGGMAVDPKQTAIPADWATLPAFQITPHTPLRWSERQRGAPLTALARLNLQRDLWLDFDGRQFTARDQITGQVFRDTRLNASPALQLAQAEIQGENQLITRDPASQLAGVEVRHASLNLSALSRLDAAQKLPVAGWHQGFESARTQLHLPPGYTLLAAPGADAAPGAWSSYWSLFDLFLLLMIVALTKHYLGWSWAIGAAAGLTLCFHEAGAPVGLWINWLAAALACRAIPSGKLKAWLSRYQHLSVIALLIVILPFIATQLRLTLHPQLENDVINDMAAFNRAKHYDTAAANAPAVAATEEAMMMSADMAAQAPMAASEGMSEPLTKMKRERDTLYAQNLQRFDPNAMVQVGPGIPNWQWNTYELNWSGPVTADQDVRLIIMSETLHRLWRLFMVAFVTIFFVKLLRSSYGWPNALRVNSATAARSLALLLLGGLWAAPQPSHAAEIPSPEMLEELKRRLLAPEPCHPQCATIARALIKGDAKRITLELDVQAQTSTTLALPTAGLAWYPDNISVDDNRDPALLNNQQSLHLALDQGAHRVTLTGPFPNQDKLSLTFPIKPRWISATLEQLELTGVQNNRLLADGIELIRIQQQTSAADSPQTQHIPPFVRIHRHLDLAMEWSMRTVVERVAPIDGAINLTLPLWPGESIVSPGLEVRNQTVTLSLPSDQQSVTWDSVLEKKSPLTLTAAADAAWTERWYLNATANWHIEHQNIPPLAWQQGNVLGAQFAPWPGEQLRVDIQKPEALPGSSIAIDHAALNLSVGQRNTHATLEFRARVSRGLQHTLGLPAGIELKSIELDEQMYPLPKPGNPVTLSLNPGEHRIKINWLDAQAAALHYRSPDIHLNAPSANITVTLQTPADRWLLWLQGPRLGPAILYWGELCALLLFAWGLSRYPRLPLNVHDWVLLGIGVSLHAWPILLLMGAWFITLDLRQQHAARLSTGGFNLAQVLLGITTVVSLASLLAVIPSSLLGRPEMSIQGNQSYDNLLRWFIDRSDGTIPLVNAWSIPVISYQIAMLAWSVWLAFSLIRWIKWGWSCFNHQGLWRARAPKLP
jgi:hypothetical protein